MAAVDPAGGEKYYIDGTTYQGVKNQNAYLDGERTFFEGRSEENIFPRNNQDTGKFFLLFE